MPSYILCAFRAAILLQNANNDTYTHIYMYIYTYIYIYTFVSVQSSQKLFKSYFRTMCFDIFGSSVVFLWRSMHILWAENEVEIIVMYAETHKHVNISWSFDYVCGANLNWLCICMLCTLIYAPYSICSADRICRLTCRRKRKKLK